MRKNNPEPSECPVNKDLPCLNKKKTGGLIVLMSPCGFFLNYKEIISSESCTLVASIIQETVEESVYVQPKEVQRSTRQSATATATVTAKSNKGESTSTGKKTSRSRLDKVWDPELQCHCRRVIGFCHSRIKYTEDGKKLCSRHYKSYLEYRDGKNMEKNDWFGVVDEMPTITNTNPKVLTRWRDGKTINGNKIQGDRYVYEGREINVNLLHFRSYVALYTIVPELDSDERVSGFLNIYTNEFTTLPIHLWDITKPMEEQRDPVEISREKDHPVYNLEIS
jgi:hypothetical protein